jgi:hypothetical protein
VLQSQKYQLGKTSIISGTCERFHNKKNKKNIPKKIASHHNDACSASSSIEYEMLSLILSNKRQQEENLL